MRTVFADIASDRRTKSQKKLNVALKEVLYTCAMQFFTITVLLDVLDKVRIQLHRVHLSPTCIHQQEFSH